MKHVEGIASPAVPGRPGPADEPSARLSESVAELAMNYCPRCSARLAARSCKMICPSCGYYMSCSDFY